MRPDVPREGDIYRQITVGGHDFTIRYGFYTDADRLSGDPIPIWPCFIECPRWTYDGYPLITRIQDACEDYLVAQGEGEGWCADCTYCHQECEQLGICRCERRRVRRK